MTTIFPSDAHPDRIQVWLDFDGTITQYDVLDALILRYSESNAWREVELLWEQGKIGSRACLTREFEFLRIDEPTLRRVLDNITLDPGAVRLLGLLQAHQVPMMVVSDGIDWFIRRILAAHGFGHLPVRANRAVHTGDRLTFSCPHHNPECSADAAHCKCASVRRFAQSGRCGVYIGDGRSDVCAARRMPIRFAKNVLARQLRAENLPYIAFQTLHDVADQLVAVWGEAQVLVA